MVEPQRILLITVDSFPIANIIEDKLSADGIVCLIDQVGDQLAGDMTTRGGLGAFAFQYQIWVSDRDLDRARAIVAPQT